MKARYSLVTLVVMLMLITSAVFSGRVTSVQANGGAPVDPDSLITSTEKVNDYYTVQHLTLPNGKKLVKNIISGPPTRPAAFAAESASVIDPAAAGAVTLSVPAFNWVMGCSAVSASMVAGYYDRNGYDNMYTGPTNGGVYPLVEDAAWGSWTDSIGDSYPNNPLIATHLGIDGRTIKGGIDDYWVAYGSSAKDPYITGGWTQHTWGESVSDYMKTSQSAYSNTDGSTSFYGYNSSTKLTCAAMLSGGISTKDGTYGRKLFYEARGYTVTDCYSQATDNRYTGGFSLVNFKAEIDAGRPVFINLSGHSIVGVGYDPSSTTIYVHDTWDNSTHTMTWGGSYSGLAMQSVSIVNLAAVTPTVPPAAPTNVSASDGTFTDKVQVSWTASTGATYYEVYRDETTSAFATVTTSPYNDTSAVPGTTYVYYVKACNSAGCSALSASDSGSRSVVTAPGAFNKTSPVNGAVNLSTRVKLKWAASSGATLYEYCYDTTDDGACTTWRSAGTATTVTISVSRRTIYYWQVRATNSGGTTFANGALTAFWSFRTK
ncbi:MAG TPA: hypothetical protein PK040_00285 [Anaerolineaceae bacterium]|nr:hypothetical protein [Anaerolineaceae bacterium]